MPSFRHVCVYCSIYRKFLIFAFYILHFDTVWGREREHIHPYTINTICMSFVATRPLWIFDKNRIVSKIWSFAWRGLCAYCVSVGVYMCMMVVYMYTHTHTQLDNGAAGNQKNVKCVTMKWRAKKESLLSFLLLFHSCTLLFLFSLSASQ